MILIVEFVHLLGFLLLLVEVQPSATAPRRTNVTAGPFTHIYDPSVGEPWPWYINDHTFVHDDVGTWHVIGITHEEPADPQHEIHFAHATASSLLQVPYKKQPYALTAKYPERLIWAPHIVKNPTTKRYHMYYCGGGKDDEHYQMQLAFSDDNCWNWTRYDKNPLFIDGFDARDPMVLQLGDRSWVMYYCATSRPSGGHHEVLYRTSTDLLSWSDRHVAYRDTLLGTYGGPTESPFVVRHPTNGHYYLFVCCDPLYTSTRVFKSKDPLHFEESMQIGAISDAHCAEVILDEKNGDFYISRAGWGKKGVYVAKLFFDE